MVTHDIAKERESLEVLVQLYPRDWAARNQLANEYLATGQYDKSLAEYRDALRLNPENGLASYGIAVSFRSLNRMEEALATVKEAMAKNLDSFRWRFERYNLAFLQNDTAAMSQQASWAKGKPGVEDWFLSSEARTAAYSGQLKKARKLSQNADVSSEATGEKEVAAYCEAEAALREALFGNFVDARAKAASALVRSSGEDVNYAAALALAIAGDTAQAQALTDDLDKRFSADTVIQLDYMSTLHAQLALNRKNTSKALEFLQAAAPYELGTGGQLDPVYIRGLAFLAAHQGKEAAVEFQAILDHRGIVLNEPIGALAHLQIARAYAMQGDTARAKASYQNFLTLWKDADPDIPIFVAAKAEYAKLK
jgi:tetratricopeptide (TPR) repeat protein